MVTESKSLDEARALLGAFENQMGRVGSLANLQGALSLLAESRENPESPNEDLLALNIATSYSKKVASEVELLLSREPAIHTETATHWLNFFAAFEQAGFALPEEVARTRSRLHFREALKAIKFMSPAERRQLQAQLEAMERENGI